MGVFSLFLSIVWLGIGGFFTAQSLLFFPGTFSAPGTVTSCQFYDDDQVCYPTISFVTKSGQKIMVTISSSGSSTYHVGDTLPVRYHPNAPQDARLDDSLTLWIPPLAGGGGFLIGLFMGIFLIKRGIRLQAGKPVMRLDYEFPLSVHPFKPK